jgi:eukaryotic translation initiation factor 2C
MTLDPTSGIRYATPQMRTRTVLREVGSECFNKTGQPPALLVVVLPEGAAEVYTEVK